MTHTLPPLPYEMDALAPYMSKETLEYHYGKHHKAYVDNLNKLVTGTEFENKRLDEIVLSAKGPIFNNAAQVWNHTFFWNGLKPGGTELADGAFKSTLVKSFGSVETFKEKFNECAMKHFGSGWAWLVMTRIGELEILSTANAENPMTEGKHPLMVCDVWEHAYYIDYRNRRADFLSGYWKLVNWGPAIERFGR